MGNVQPVGDINAPSFFFISMQLSLISIPLSGGEGGNDERLEYNLPARLFQQCKAYSLVDCKPCRDGNHTAKKLSCTNVLNRWMTEKMIYHLVQSTSLQELTEKGCASPVK